MANKSSNALQFVFYDNTNIEVIIKNDTVWTTQKGMAEIFEVQIPTISKHLKNIFAEGELDEKVVVSILEITTQHGAMEGKTQNVETQFYNLDAVIAVGYRVNSKQATQFRIWATNVLKEYLIKGFALDDDRLKQGSKLFGKDYFDELLERIREIRASERLFYKKIADIYAECSIDYDKDAEITHEFYAVVQNKLHFAVHGHTAAELIYSRADAKKPKMGLMSWESEKRGGKILQSDTLIAKNYLNKQEISELNRVVNMYLDYAENQAKRQIPMKMADWVKKLDAFLGFNDYEILKNAGKISKKVADELAKVEYEKFRVIQDKEFISDFDKAVKNIKAINKLLSKGKR
ncbi:MAG: virulence RhuM family protein [Campylobacteraceae bacterium]|jgi:hypothetical protein|nr:virulence RhuM family protein [Campylobacteraceae bacterium]